MGEDHVPLNGLPGTVGKKHPKTVRVLQTSRKAPLKKAAFLSEASHSLKSRKSTDLTACEKTKHFGMEEMML